MTSPPDRVSKDIMFSGCPSAFVCSSGHILLLRYLINSLSNLDEIYGACSLVPTDDLLRFWRSTVKATAGHRVGEGNRVDAGASKNPSSSFRLLFTPCISCV